MNEEKEITVMVNMTLEELIKCLEQEEYQKIDDYYLYDIYYINKNITLNNNPLSILNKCILLRNFYNSKCYLTYKHKEYDDNENIIRQTKTEVEVKSLEDAKNFLEALEYKELINIKDHILVYSKDNFEIAIEYVNDKYLMIEVESNEKYPTIESLIEKLSTTSIKYDKSNYYVKKAKIVFEETYKDNERLEKI